MSRYVWRDGQGWVERHKAKPLRRPGRSELSGPMVIRDFQEPVFSHADGRTYTSRKHWNDHLKAHGKVEVGNEKPKPKAPESAFTEAEIADAYDQYDAMTKAGWTPEKSSDKPPEYWEGDVQEVADDV